MKAPTKPERPTRFGKFLLAERYKMLGRYLQLKFGRRVLLEVRIGQIGSFRDSEAYATLSNQAKEWHSAQWEPPAMKKKSKAPRIEQPELAHVLDVLKANASDKKEPVPTPSTDDVIF